MSSNVITYEPAQPHIRVGVPFTWGAGDYWAIKMESGNIYWLHSGKQLQEESCGAINKSSLTYANSIEIK
ncbi:hypothetical protein KpIITR008_26 [Klebsiella phage KpIITR008]